MEVVSDRLSRGGELSMEYLADEEEVKRARDAAMRVVRCMLDVGVCVCIYIVLRVCCLKACMNSQSIPSRILYSRAASRASLTHCEEMG
jgi:hypothetical protein